MENNTEPTTPIHMSLREAASYLRVARWTLQRAVEKGELQAFRIGGRRLTIRRIDLDRWLDRFAIEPFKARSRTRLGNRQRSE